METVATLAYEAGIGRGSRASHTTAAHSRNGVHRGCSAYKMSGINFVANPLVNIRSQGA